MKKLLIAALLAGSAAVPGGFAHADCTPTTTNPVPDPNCNFLQADCGFNTIASEQATGGQDTFTGVAYGYVGSASGGAVTVRCLIRVNGGEAATTPTGSGTGFATAQGQVTFTASDTDDVDLCAAYTTPEGSGENCDDTQTTQIPPQEVVDLTALPDFLLCPVLASLAGEYVPGVVSINDEGDVDVSGGVWDCPPYDA